MSDKARYLKRKEDANKGARKVDRPRDAGERLDQEQKQAQDDVRRIFDMAREINFNVTAETDRLKKFILTEADHLGDKGKRVLVELVSYQNFREQKPFWSEECAGELLVWMLRERGISQYFSKRPEGARDEISHRLPLHLAIDKEYYRFLACFLRICKDPRIRAGNVMDEVEDQNKLENAIHFAMKKLHPFAAYMTTVCSKKALLDTDSEGNTPLLLAMESEVRLTKNVPPEATPYTGASFSPHGVWQAIKSRKDAKDLLPDLLKVTNHAGFSPYSLRRKVFDAAKRGFEEENLQTDLKKHIFENVKGISNVSKALYGTKGDDKELCLDMSDFNQSTHDFLKFVKQLTALDGRMDLEGSNTDLETQLKHALKVEDNAADVKAETKQVLEVPSKDIGSKVESKQVLQFEETLFFVHLPDFNYVRMPRPHEGVGKLFSWLQTKNVKTIKRLHIPDSTISPMSDEFVESAILDKFMIEELDWRKLDLNLDVLTRAKNKDHITDLSLYSSGNWSVLYHWISIDGLAKLPKLKTVRIEIVQLDTSEGLHDAAAHKRHRELANKYREEMFDKCKMRKSKSDRTANDEATEVSRNWNYVSELTIEVNTNWDYPIRQDQEGDQPVAVKHQLKAQLLPYTNTLDKLKETDVSKAKDDSYASYAKRFRRLVSPPEPDAPDRRIKVAIIDNGVDRIRASVRNMIAKGISFVAAGAQSADQNEKNEILPWWMVADPHGTQMASLIGQTNPYCRLYVARVGKGRADILTENAVEAIEWALGQEVDIISISWVKKRHDQSLENAINAAVEKERKHKALVFCSTADEGAYSGAVWPAEHTGVLRVSATDKYGHLTPRSNDLQPVDIQIPGENIDAAGPIYMSSSSVGKTVSGSSVATALAAGVASLALIMLQTFNHLNEKELDHIHTRECMKVVFEKMNAHKSGIQISNLFPPLPDSTARLEALKENWNKENFWDPNRFQ